MKEKKKMTNQIKCLLIENDKEKLRTRNLTWFLRVCVLIMDSFEVTKLFFKQLLLQIVETPVELEKLKKFWVFLNSSEKFEIKREDLKTFKNCVWQQRQPDKFLQFGVNLTSFDTDILVLELLKKDKTICLMIKMLLKMLLESTQPLLAPVLKTS